jgi:hypothetical protein
MVSGFDRDDLLVRDVPLRVGLRNRSIIHGVKVGQPPLSLSTRMQVGLVLPETSCQLPWNSASFDQEEAREQPA